jgi:hypothetical protein
MQRVRAALAAIRDGGVGAADTLEKGIREAPEVFIPGVVYFIVEALRGAVVDPEKLPEHPL